MFLLIKTLLIKNNNRKNRKQLYLWNTIQHRKDWSANSIASLGGQVIQNNYKKNNKKREAALKNEAGVDEKHVFFLLGLCVPRRI